MGKKIALGCLGVGMILLVGGGYLGYNYLVKPMMGSFSTLEEINQKNQQIENQSPYTPPEEGELTEDQVERFVTAQRQIRQDLEDLLTEFQEKYEELGQEWEQRDPSIREMMRVWDDLIGLYSDAKQVQIDVLNDTGFSLEEYRFVQQSFYQAMGVEMFAYNIDEIAKAASEGDFNNMDMEQFQKAQKQIEEVPEKNRELVAPYTESAEDWLVFAWWGL